jgi:creatinine amidohydrolase/Fe(II)-dependent formamide hydrolase-like protein
MQSIQLEELTWPKVKAALDNGYDTVVFGVGSTEQHGTHLPLASDTLMGEWLAEATAQRLGKSLVAPTIRVGCSQHHLTFPGTMSIESPTLRELLMSYATTLLSHGFRRIVIIPSHGGNFQVVGEVVAELNKQFPDKQAVTFADLKRLIDSSHKLSSEYGVSPGASGAHAGEFETSILLFLRPDLVEMDRAEEGFTKDIGSLIPDLLKFGLAKVTANGVLGDARPADASRGERYLLAWLDLILAEIERTSVAA